MQVISVASRGHSLESVPSSFTSVALCSLPNGTRLQRSMRYPGPCSQSLQHTSPACGCNHTWSVTQNKRKKRYAETTDCELGSLDDLRASGKGGLDPNGRGSTVVATDVLWSDPVGDEGLCPNSSRGVGVIFGPDVTQVGFSGLLGQNFDVSPVWLSQSHINRIY